MATLHWLLVLLTVICAKGTQGQSAPRISPTTVNVVANQDNFTLDCNVGAIASVTNEDVVWYQLDREGLASFPQDGSICETSGSGGASGAGIGDLFGGEQFNVTGKIVANGTFSLTFDPVEFGDEGYYACVVLSGGEQRCFSNYVTVTVSPVGSVSIFPRDRVFEQGTNATLTCDNRGGPDNTIIWNATGDSLPFTESHQITVLVSESIGGTYTCNVSNAAGFETDSTVLYVHPLITANPEPFVDVTNGTVASFSCDAEGFPEPMYQWIRSDGSAVRSDVTDTNRTNVLGFEPVVFGDEGTYICRSFININGMVYEVNSTATVLTLSPEGTVVASPLVRDSIPGDDIAFNCSSLGGPGNNVTWTRQRDGAVVEDGSMLTLTEVDGFDGGQYQCLVENRAGSGTANVTLYVGPAFMDNPLQQTPTMLELFSLSCTAIAFPAVDSIIWFHNDTLVDANSSRVDITTESADAYSTTSTLTIMSAQADDSGSYYCVASSPRQVYSNVTSDPASVSVLNTPERPQNITALEIQSRYLILTWIEPHDNNAPVLGYLVQYNQPEFDGGLMVVLNVSEAMVNITALYPGVMYNFTVIAFNEVGNSSLSVLTPFTTLDEVPSSPPLNVSFSVNSSTEILVTWEDVPAIDRNGIIVTYEVLYEPQLTFDGQLSSATVNASELSLLLTGLQKFNSYNISVRAYTSVGPGPYSVGMLAMTLEDVPGSSPDNITALVRSPRSIVVSWEEVPAIEQNGVITGYQLRYEPLMIFGSEARETILDVTAPSRATTLSGLQEYVQYNISVRALTVVGPGPYSTPITVITDEDAPSSAPQNVRAVATSSIEISVSWDEVPAGDQNGVISAYEVSVEPRTTFDGALTQTTFNVTNMTVLLGGLHPYVNYTISVRAYTSVGPGPNAAVTEATLQDSPASAPQNVTSSAPSPTSIFVSWEEIPPFDRNGIVETYEVVYNPFDTFDGQLMQEARTTSELFIVLNDLEEYLDYNITVRGYTSAGPGPFSDTITEMTPEDVPDAGPDNVRSEVLSSVSIAVYWDEVPLINQNGNITMYEVLYVPLQTFGETLSSSTISTTDFETVINGLAPYVSYNISVRAYTVVGAGPYSEPVVNRTLEEAPNVAPGNVMINIVNSTSFNISWDDIPPVERNGLILTYEVLYEPQMTLGGVLMPGSIETSALYVVLGGLQEFVVYNISVRAYTSEGPGPYSDELTEMTPEDRPASPPDNVEAMVTSPRSINVTWEEVPLIDQNGDIARYEVRYRPLETFGDAIRVQFVNTSNLSYELVNLEEFVSYNISVRAYTSVGPGPYSDPITERTFQDAPSSAPVNVSAVVESPTSIAVRWEDIPPIEQNGEIVEYEVLYEPLNTFNGAIAEDRINTTNTSIILSNLQEFVNYNISVRGYTIAGPGNYSDPVTVMTLEATPAVAPDNVMTQVLSSTSISVSWEAIPPLQRNGIIRGYQVLYEPLETFDGLIRPETVNTTNLTYSIVLVDLFEYVEYNISVRAFTSIGFGPYSEEITNRTDQDLPASPPVNVDAVVLSSTSIMVSWGEVPSSDQNGLIIDYEVLIEPMVTFDDMIMEQRINSTDQFSVNITGLQEFVNYSISVRAYTIVGPGNYSDVIVRMTLEDVPRIAPLNVASLVLSPTSIMVLWEEIPAIDRNGIIVSYEVLYEPQETFNGRIGNQSVTTSSTELSVQLEGLEEYVNYTISVRASTRVGAGVYSNPIVNQTLEDVPDMAPVNVVAQSLTSTSIRVTWEEVPEINRNGIIDEYEVCYDPLETFGGLIMEGRVNTSDLSYNISGLQEFVNYTITVRAYTSVGPGPDSEANTEMTLEDRPALAPLNVMSEPTSSTTAYVSWEEIPEISRNGIIVNYQVQFQRSPPDGLSSGSVVTIRSNSLDVNITELEEYANYSISVRASTSAGPGNYSEAVVIETFQDRPGRVPRPPVPSDNEITATRATVRWSPPTDPNGIITDYRVTYTVMQTLPENKSECIIGDPSRSTPVGSDDTELELRDLTPYSMYRFEVVASTKIGEGLQFSRSQMFMTKESVSSAPLSLTAEYVSGASDSSTTLQLTWTHPLCDYGERTGYDISYTPVIPDQASDGQASADHSATTTTLSSLAPNTNYTISICAITSVGCGNATTAVGLTDEDAPHDIITLNITSMRRGDDSNNSVIVNFDWTQPSDRNGSYKFEVRYTATQMFQPANPIHTRSIVRQLLGEQTAIQLSDGLPYAQYNVMIFAYNIKRGRRGPVVSMTYLSIPIEPTSVNNLTAFASSPTSIRVMWSPPTYPNGPITNYIVFYREGDTAQKIQPISSDEFSSVTTQKGSTSQNITELKPYTNYTIHVQAIISAEMLNNEESFTDDLLGAVDVEIVARTNGTRPDNPVNVMMPLSGPTATTFQISIPSTLDEIDTGNVLEVQLVVVRNPIIKSPGNYTNLTAYMEGVMVYIAAAWRVSAVPERFTVGDMSRTIVDNVEYVNAGLAPNTRYGYFIRYVIENDANSRKPHYHYSQFVETMTALPFSVPGLVIGLIIIISVIAAAVIVVAIFIFRKKKQQGLFAPTTRDGYINDPNPQDNKKELFTPVFTNPLAEYSASHEPIPVEDLADHVRTLHANDDYLFTEEYTSVEPNHSPTTEATRRPENISKNRYANITSYDHSRVRLTENTGIPGSDYINANFLDGYERDNAFIATQGPVPGTVQDFWRMVWEQGTAVIVMVTNLEEKGRVKCFKYWPDEKTMRQGNIRIIHQETLQLAEYTVRTFSLQRESSKEERIIRQFHFTVWPDHGVPAYPSPLLGFVRKVMNTSPSNAGPIVVHCSAGVGRTGTFITLFCQLQRISKEGNLDIFNFVRAMRRRRCFMVQTESQYVFIHDALLEAIDCGETEVPARKLREEYRKLGNVDVQRGQTGLEIEFSKLQSSIRIHSMKTHSTMPSNKSKNRYADMEMLPYDKTRVRLRPSPGVAGSDYINASHIDGYHKRKAFIATQAPLPDTTEDFWRMIWEQNCATIVMLTREREGGRVKCHKYWPDSGACSFNNLQVILHTHNEFPDYILREFKIVDTRDNSSIPVKQFQYTGWPEESVPDVGSGLIDVIGQVQKWQRSSGDQPIVVHCSGGCGRTGTYIAISILLERLKTEGVVDVFQTARTLRLQRPSMIQSVGQYEFCYKTVLEFLVSFDTYANFK